MVVGGQEETGRGAKLFKTEHIRSKFAKIKEERNESFDEDTDEPDQSASEREFAEEEDLKDKDQRGELARDSDADHESAGDSLVLVESRAEEEWASDAKGSIKTPAIVKNPFKNSEIQESLAKLEALTQEATRGSMTKEKQSVKSQTTSQGDSINSLIYSNENALKNIIQAHDLKIEESFGKEQIEYFKSKSEAQKRRLGESEEQKHHLDVIPETDGRMIFTLKGTDRLGRGPRSDQGPEAFGALSAPQSFRIQRSPEETSPKGHGQSISDSYEGDAEEKDPEVDYLMDKLAQVMEAEPHESLEESLAETQLDVKTRKILVRFFRKQEEKFRENQKRLKSTYQQLKEEKVHIEDHLQQLGDVYKAQISQLEKANKEQEKEIKKLKKKNRLLGIKGKRQASKAKSKPKSREQSKGKMTDKYYSDKIKNLSRLLEEKNRKIQLLNSKIDDIKIDNQAMKELLREFSSQGST